MAIIVLVVFLAASAFSAWLAVKVAESL